MGNPVRWIARQLRGKARGDRELDLVAAATGTQEQLQLLDQVTGSAAQEVLVATADEVLELTDLILRLGHRKVLRAAKLGLPYVD